MSHTVATKSRDISYATFEFDRRDDLEDLDALMLLGGGQRHAPQSGIRALMLAVLEDGIRCYFSRVPRMRAEAEHWIHAGTKRTAFSFDVICELFGLEADAARASLADLRRTERRPGMLRKRHRGAARQASISLS